jgi:hypothetical protein
LKNRTAHRLGPEIWHYRKWAEWRLAELASVDQQLLQLDVEMEASLQGIVMTGGQVLPEPIHAGDDRDGTQFYALGQRSLHKPNQQLRVGWIHRGT